MRIEYNGLILIAMAFVLFAAASNTQSGWQYIISALLFAIVILGVIIPGMQIKGLNVLKELPVRLYAGKSSVVNITIENLSQRNKWFFNLVESPVSSADSAGYSLSSRLLIERLVTFLVSTLSRKKDLYNFFVNTIPARHFIDFNYDFIPEKRGVYKVGLTTLSTSSPLGIATFSKTFKNEQEVVIYPKVFDIRGGWVNRIASRSMVNQLSYSYTPTSIPGITRSVREYVPGDSPRHIHWPTSARVNKLFVRDFEVEASGYIVIFLDSYDDYIDEKYFDLAVTTVSSLLNASHEKGLVSRFITQYDALQGIDYRDEVDWYSQLEVLARVQPVSKLSICTEIDTVHQGLISQYPGLQPSYVLVSSQYKANYSANRANIISIKVSPYPDEFVHYTVKTEEDLKFI